MTAGERPEPRLDELLDDPLVEILMRSDSVDRDALMAMLTALRADRRSPPSETGT